jgi:beta-glucosidase
LHRFTLSGAGSARLVIDGQVVARYDRVDFGDIEHAALNLTAGRSVAIRVDYTPREAAPMPVMPMMATTLGGHVRIGLAEPDDRIAQAVAAARAADVAVVFAANRQGEGADRTLLNLPPDQDALIAAVTAANPRTVVVLGAGSQIAMPWRDKVAGILQLWYAGEAFGPAAAALILGEASPGGRLPVTFPGDPAQGPGTDAAHYPGSANAQGELTDVRFDEGTLVGYRWHLGHPRQKPLYPFGYGLSYGDARLSRFAAAPRKDGAITVTAQAANRGSHRAVEVIQAYVVLPGKAGQSIPKLAGFTKVALEPGEMRSVEMTVPATAFDYWDEDARAWRTWDGRYELRVGRSAAVADFRKHLTR